MKNKPGARAEERHDQRWDAVSEAGELMMERRFDEALVELKRVLEADAQNAYAFNLAGQALYELDRLEPARDAFRAAVLVSPDFLGARVALSHVLRRLGDAPEAEQQARVALSRFPGDGDAMHALGLALAARGKRKEARRHLEGFLSTNPEFEATTEVRGILEMLGLGEEDEPLDIE
ncbi:MAG: tetratricopeptide repeat protein [Polyangiaceae bacterium]